MDCRKNDFCRSLPDEVRTQLCAHCHRRLTRAGSIQLYSDFERHATLILDGAIKSSIYVGEDVLDYSEDVPTFHLGIPGRILATNMTFGRTEKMHYGNNGVEYLTDCCVATFEHEAMLELFETDNGFARSMALSMIRIMEDTCEIAAILRAQSVHLSVHHLTQLLLQHHIYLTQQQLADVINHDRASVSKALARVKSSDPDLFNAYLSNKGRAVEMFNPGD